MLATRCLAVLRLRAQCTLPCSMQIVFFALHNVRKPSTRWMIAAIKHDLYVIGTVPGMSNFVSFIRFVVNCCLCLSRSCMVTQWVLLALLTKHDVHACNGMQ